MIIKVIELDTKIDYNDQPKGADLLVYDGGAFTPGASGTIKLNVYLFPFLFHFNNIIIKGGLWLNERYAADDSDSVSFFSSSACRYAGTLHFTFQYTPSAGDKIYIGSTQQ